jgi:hypothetical protein
MVWVQPRPPGRAARSKRVLLRAHSPLRSHPHAPPAGPQVRTVPVETRAVPLDQLRVPQRQVQELSSVEASLRLDAIASAGEGLRQMAAACGGGIAPTMPGASARGQLQPASCTGIQPTPLHPSPLPHAPPTTPRKASAWAAARWPTSSNRGTCA